MVVDQHFHNRRRLKRLQGVLAKHPAYMGLGIDEETAVVLKGLKATVLGNANVRVCLPMAVGKLPAVQVLKAGDDLDLGPLCQTLRRRPGQLRPRKRRMTQSTRTALPSPQWAWRRRPHAPATRPGAGWPG